MHHASTPPGSVLEDRFGDIVGRNVYVLTPFHVGDAPLIHRIGYRVPDVVFVAIEEAFSVDRALVLRITASVYNE